MFNYSSWFFCYVYVLKLIKLTKVLVSPESCEVVHFIKFAAIFNVFIYLLKTVIFNVYISVIKHNLFEILLVHTI